MQILIAVTTAKQSKELEKIITNNDHSVTLITPEDIITTCKKSEPDLIFIATSSLTKTIRELKGSFSWVKIAFIGDVIHSNNELDYILSEKLDPEQINMILHSAERYSDLKNSSCAIAHELMLANHELEHLVIEDQLTGFANATSFEDLLEEQWFKAKRDSNTLGIVLLDLDYFQKFKQMYGVEKADEAVKKISLAMQQALPNHKKLIARTAKANFAVLLPNVNSEQATQMAEKLHSAVNFLKIPHDGSGCNVYLTTSIGAAVTDNNTMKTPWDLVDAADYAVYKAKHAGRNKVFAE